MGVPGVDRVAVCVDAGYFFAQGSTALWGAKQPRSTLDVNEAAAIAELTAVATARAPTASLLRIYWYDGALGKPSLEQLRLAQCDNVKVRLGFINSVGQQKGVDSLIVTDLVELARNRAASDVVLLAGDEDVRIGVQIAQSFGVRIHLLGIAPSRGSQSQQLMQEADTTLEWDAAMMGKMLTKRAPKTVVVLPAAAASPPSQPILIPAAAAPAPIDAAIAGSLDTVADALAAGLSPADIAGIKAYWASHQRGVPAEFDGRLIAIGRSAIGRDLVTPEKRYMRARFSAAVRAKS